MLPATNVDPSDALLQVASRTSKTAQLHVSNIPIELSEEGLRNLFQKHGTLVHVFANRSAARMGAEKTWGKVTFASEVEAKTAIAELDGKPPLRLRIRVARTPEEEMTIKAEERKLDLERIRQMERMAEFDRTGGLGDVGYSVDSVKPLFGRTKHLQIMAARQGRDKPTFLPSSFPMAHQHGYSSTGEVPDSWNQSKITKRALQLPSINANEKPFQFGHRIAISPAPVQDCLCCGQPGRVRCSRCKSWYCTQRCQANHWPVHRPDCERPPPLENPDGTPYHSPSTSLRPKKRKPGEETERVTVVKETTVINNPDQPIVISKSESDANPSLGPDEPQPRLPDFKDAVYSKTLLDDVKIGDTVMFIVALDTSIRKVQGSVVSTVTSFSAFYCDESEEVKYILDGVCTDFKKTEGCKAGLDVKNLIPGQIFVADMGDDLICRFMTTKKESEEGVSAYCIDRPASFVLKPSQLALEFQKCLAIPSAGFKFTCLDAVKPALSSQIKNMCEEVLCFKVQDIKKYKDGRLKKLNMVLIDDQDQPLIRYSAVPWYKGNPDVQNLLDVPADEVMLQDLKKSVVVVGDKVVKIGFGETCDMVVVVKAADVAKLTELKAVMEAEGAGAEGYTALPKEGQVVACRWSEDQGIYRAVVRKVNAEQRKVRVRFLDYGNYSIEDLGNVYDLPDSALDSERFPCLASLLPVHGVEGAVKVTEDSGQVKMKSLDPVFESNLEVSDIIDGKFVLTHPNGKTVGDILTNKLKEPVTANAEVQGMEVGGQFHYEQCHFAELRVDENDQEVAVLHVESPTEIFVCPLDQLGVAETLNEQIRNYVAAAQESFSGSRPSSHRMCVAKASDDQWYRATCVEHLPHIEGNEAPEQFRLLFADYGFQELVSPSNILPMNPELMKVPLLANHCILDGFQDESRMSEFQEKYSDVLKQLLPVEEIAKLKVTGKHSAASLIQVKGLEEQLKVEFERTKQDANANEIPVKEADVPAKELVKEEEPTTAEPVPDKRDDFQSLLMANDHAELKEGSENSVLVLHCESPCEVFVCPEDQIELLGELPAAIKETIDALRLESDFRPSKIGEGCFAHSVIDDTWYRGVVREILDENKFKIRYVDFGSDEILTSARLTKPDSDMMGIPFVSRQCAFDAYVDGLSSPDLSADYKLKFGEVLSTHFGQQSQVTLKVLNQTEAGIYRIEEPADVKTLLKPQPIENEDKNPPEETKSPEVLLLEKQMEELRKKMMSLKS